MSHPKQELGVSSHKSRYTFTIHRLRVIWEDNSKTAVIEEKFSASRLKTYHFLF